jgi:hypothetical protein
MIKEGTVFLIFKIKQKYRLPKILNMKKINTQRILLTTLVAVAFFGFLLWSLQQTQSEEESLVNDQILVSGKSPLINAMIRMEEPKYSGEIKSPVAISGQANLLGNKLKIRIVDNKNLILKEAFVQTKNLKQMSDFSTNLVYKKPTSSKGTIEVFLVSSKDSSEIYKIQIPVVFKD